MCYALHNRSASLSLSWPVGAEKKGKGFSFRRSFSFQQLFFSVRRSAGLKPTFPFWKAQLSDNNEHLWARDTARSARPVHQSHGSHQQPPEKVPQRGDTTSSHVTGPY